MTLHAEVLGDEQMSVLPALARVIVPRVFYLGGGTAVALHLGHRRSVDFDWFARDGYGDPLVLAQQMRQECLHVEDVQASRGTLHAVVNGVRVSLFEYPYSQVASTTPWADYGLSVASLDDLGCMKLAAIAQRGSRKDFIDLYFICREHRPIEELIGMFRRKYVTADIGPVLVGLAYFDDAEDEPHPTMIRDASWEQIKSQCRDWARLLAA